MILMVKKLKMMIWCLFLLLKEELWNTWINFLKNIEKSCPKTKKNTFNAQELLVIQLKKLSLWQMKDSVTNQIPLQKLKSFKLMKITKNIFKITNKQWGIQVGSQMPSKMNWIGSRMPVLLNFYWKLKKNMHLNLEKSHSSERNKRESW